MGRGKEEERKREEGKREKNNNRRKKNGKSGNLLSLVTLSLTGQLYLVIPLTAIMHNQEQSVDLQKYNTKLKYHLERRQ